MDNLKCKDFHLRIEEEKIRKRERDFVLMHGKFSKQIDSRWHKTTIIK